MKPIQTEYNKIRFCSPPEARWAGFLDALVLVYRYEPEGYQIGNSCYLIDFFIPEWDSYLEVKSDVVPSLMING